MTCDPPASTICLGTGQPYRETLPNQIQIHTLFRKNQLVAMSHAIYDLVFARSPRTIHWLLDSTSYISYYLFLLGQ